MQEIGVKYGLDLDEFFKNSDRIFDTLGKIDEAISRSSKKNPLAEAAAKQVQFNQQLGLQVQIWQGVEKAATSYRREQERVRQATADIKKSQDELAAAKTYGELKKQIGQVETALDKSINKPLKESISWFDKLKARFAEGLKIPKINVPDLPDKTKGEKKESLSQAIVDQVGDAAGLNLSGGTLAAAGAVAAVAGTVIKGTKEWSEYGAVLSEVSALTGATGKSLEYLNDQAQQIEKETGIAGTTVLEAFKNIAGIKPELLEDNEALAQTTKEVITLSQASKLGLEDSAKALLGSLSQFEEGADQAARFSNVLAAGAKLGNSEINDTSEALKNSGTAMKAAGLSFEQGNALLQILAGKMIKGGEAGTALRNVLIKLETDTDRNLRPSIVGLDKALENAAKKYDTTSEKAKVFGAENIIAATQVLESRDAVAKMTETLTGTSVAYDQAMTNTDNLATDLKKASTSISSFFRDMAESEDGFLRFSVQAFTSFLNQLTAKNGEFKAFFRGLWQGVKADFTGGVGPKDGAFGEAFRQRDANILAEQRRIQNQTVKETATTNVGNFIKTKTDSLVESGVSKNDAGVQAAQEATIQAQAKLNQVRKQYNDTATALRTANGEQRKQLIEDGKLDALAIKQARENVAVATSSLAQAKKAKQAQADALKKALGEPLSDAQKQAGKKAQDVIDENNRLLLAAKEDYLKEVQKLESEYGKERLESLQKDGQAYINARADLDQKELALQRDAIEKKLQLAKSTKTAEVNGKRQVIADTSITLDNSAPMVAAIFAERQKQIEDQRARDLQLSRIRQEYKLLELAKDSNETELQRFDAFWEEKLLIEKKNTETYDSLLKQREEARKIIAGTGTKEEIAEFEKAWELILANEEKNSAVYKAMILKRNRDRNALAVDLILKQTKNQEGIETAFSDTNQFETNLRADDPSLNADDIIEKREQAKLAIRIKYGEETIKLLKEQGEAENALLITQTQAAVDGLKKQQTELTNNTPKNRDIYELLGITNGMNDEQLASFRDSMAKIGDAIQSTTQLIIEQSDEKISALDAQIQAKNEQVSIEEERDKEGYANNLALRRAELEDLKRQKAEEEEVKKKALAVQQAIDAATAISNQAVAISEGIRFLTSYASRSAALGPIAGPIAYFATVASILASIYAVTKQFKALTAATSKLREGGKLRGNKHEAGGIRGTGTFSDIEVEGGEHVTNAKASAKFDKTLEALNENDPHRAIAALVREGRIGLPGLIVAHINQADFGSQKHMADLNVLTSEIREHKEVTKLMLSYMKKQGAKKQITAIGNGVIIEQEGNHTSYKDIRSELTKIGIKTT